LIVANLPFDAWVKDAIANVERTLETDSQINEMLENLNCGLTVADFGSQAGALRFVQEKNTQIALDKDKAERERDQAAADLAKADDIISDLRKELEKVNGSTKDAGTVSDKGNEDNKSDSIGPVSDNTNPEQKAE